MLPAPPAGSRGAGPSSSQIDLPMKEGRRGGREDGVRGWGMGGAGREDGKERKKCSGSYRGEVQGTMGQHLRGD